MPIIGKLTKRDGTVILPNTRAEAVIMDDEGTTLTEAMEDVQGVIDALSASTISNTPNGSISATNVQDAINELDSEKAFSTIFYATLPSTSWTGSSAPYTKAVTVNGILGTDTPFIDIVQSGVYETDQITNLNWSLIYRAVTSTNTITFYANDIPTADIQIQIKVVR